MNLTAKHFIIDDICAYIGSQNLYICDLAEWGVVIDDAKTVVDFKSQYWEPMWKVSYTIDDCEVGKVMDGLNIDRTAPSKTEMNTLHLQEIKKRIRATENIPASSSFHAKPKTDSAPSEEEEEEEDEESEAED